MSANQSNLSSEKYDYDLVTSATQSSINATMKAYLDGYEGEEFVQCYVYVPGEGGTAGTYELTDYVDLQIAIGGDPFTIANGDISNPMVAKLQQNMFAFGFKAKMGLPENLAPYQIPDVITLDKGNTMVSYNLFFKEFQIIELGVGYQTTWTNLNQYDDGQNGPWVFNFNVDLDFQSSDSAFNDLTDEIQDQVKNLCPDTMFSVQQLYLDLNTAGLDSAPTVVGLDDSSQAYFYLTQIFINTYFDGMKENSATDSNPEGNYLLGYGIQPSTTPPPSVDSSIIPTDLTFDISPNVDENGAATGVYDLYTLNWLVMTEGRRMPAAAPFDWNWVEAADQSNFSGAMSINRRTFAAYINQLLSPSLVNICLIPTCSLSPTMTMSCSVDPNPHSFTYVDNNDSKVLTFSYSKSDSDEGMLHTGFNSMEVTTKAQSDIYFTGTKIQTITTSTCHLELRIDGGLSEGDIVKYRCTTDYDISIDEYGNLAVTQEEPVFEDLSDFDVNLWSQIATLDTIQLMVNSIEDFWTCMDDFMGNQNTAIAQMLTGSSVWVFPGGSTFTFKNAMFSDNQDLVSEITYVDPS